jgi:hypothetical protein
VTRRDDERVSRLVAAARGDSVTRALLAGAEGPGLADRLVPDEQPHYVLRGAVVDVVDRTAVGSTDDGSEHPPGAARGVARKMADDGREVLTTVTDRRVLVVVPRSGERAADERETTYDDAESAKLERMGDRRRLTVETPTEELRADVAASSASACEAAVSYVRERIASTEFADDTDDPLSAIERLADLRERGAITEAEFREKKAVLLDRL